MNLRDAILLVRAKYQEEQQGVTDGEAAAQYQEAVALYPVTMATAVHNWASQLSESRNPSQRG